MPLFLDLCVLPGAEDPDLGSLVVGNLRGRLRAGRKYHVEIISVEDDGPFEDANTSTPSEVAESVYAYSRVGASALMQRYGLLAGDPRRSDAEEAEQWALRERLVQLGCTPGWDAVKRKKPKVSR